MIFSFWGVLVFMNRFFFSTRKIKQDEHLENTLLYALPVSVSNQILTNWYLKSKLSDLMKNFHIFSNPIYIIHFSVIKIYFLAIYLYYFSNIFCYKSCFNPRK